MESEVADGLIEYLHATNPSMATKLTMERMNMVKQILALRARVGELEKALQVMTDVAQEQVRRLERWSKVHNELDGAIANARAVLEKTDED